MEFHRTGKMADWDVVPLEKRNRWQRVAAATHGYVTPGNFVSVVGLAGSIWGFVLLYQGELAPGFIVLLAGRICDVLDGYAAHYTGTKSTVGETVDAGADKFVMLAGLVVLFSTDLVPLWLLVALGVQQLVAAGLGGYARLQHMGMHPSRLGKLTAVAQWTALLGCILASISDAPSFVMALTQVLLAAAIIVGVTATWGYVRHVLGFSRRDKTRAAP